MHQTVFRFFPFGHICRFFRPNHRSLLARLANLFTRSLLMLSQCTKKLNAFLQIIHPQTLPIHPLHLFNLPRGINLEGSSYLIKSFEFCVFTFQIFAYFFNRNFFYKLIIRPITRYNFTICIKEYTLTFHFIIFKLSYILSIIR